MKINLMDLKRLETLFEDRFIRLKSTYKPNKHTFARLQSQGFLNAEGQLSAKAIQEVLRNTNLRMVLMRKKENGWEKLDKEQDRWFAATKAEVDNFINLALNKEGRFSQSGEIFIFTYRELKGK